jgi:hypothetical protein
MLRRRPRRTAPSWLRHPAAVPLCLGVLYLAATVATMLLAFSMVAWWPALLAIALAVVTMLCAMSAWRRL